MKSHEIAVAFKILTTSRSSYLGLYLKYAQAGEGGGGEYKPISFGRKNTGKNRENLEAERRKSEDKGKLKLKG
jgi:hypothetical protein